MRSLRFGSGSPRGAPTAPPGRYVRVVGLPGSGKTTLATELGWRLDLPVFDIAAMPGHRQSFNLAWEHLASRLTPPAIVETMGTSMYEGGFWDDAVTFTIHVAAPVAIRCGRLLRRGLAESEVKRMIAFREPEGADLFWRGVAASGDTRPVADLVAAWLG